MDEQPGDSTPPGEANGLARGQNGGQAAVEDPLIATGAQRPVTGPDGRFVPGVLQPVGRPWRPGQSGNPAGYSNAGRLTRRLVAALEKDDGKLADALTTVILKKALSGDYKFAQELINRVEGRVAERLAGHDGGPLGLPSITVVKSYAGDRPAGEAGAEGQPPELPPPPEPSQLP